MKTAFSLALALLILCQLTNAVHVKEGDFVFSLESVKKLGDLMRSVDATAKTGAVAVCADPALPVEFQPLCQSKEAWTSFTRLAFVAANPDACEICSYVACTGC